MNSKTLKCISIVFVSLLVFGIGVLIGLLIHKKPHYHLHNSPEREAANSKSARWQFINPLLDCGDLDNVSNESILGFKGKLEKLIVERTRIGDIKEASVYFRDLNNGPWFGINERKSSTPASLLKVPLAMSVFAYSEKNPSILATKFKYKGGSNNYEYFKASKELEKGDEYSVSDALKFMIRYSDNNAYYVLYNAMSSTLWNTYSYLGMPTPDKIDYTIDSKTYASFFRILYNSTYLNRENSEQMLQLLSDTEFDQGLVAGLPRSVTVAHKFGERQNKNGDNYLHDCGIIYEEKTPYILCIMTEGSNLDKMAGVIADVSRAVYEEVNEGASEAGAY